jgi:prepilin-type processing-associated H-X9-DG protein
MNGLGSSLVWGAIQVTLFCVVGAFVYVLSRRRGPSTGALVAFAVVLLVFAVSLLALSPWPHWWDLNPQIAGAATVAVDNEPTAASEGPDDSVRNPKAEVGTALKKSEPGSTVLDKQALWKAAWAGMIEGMHNSSQEQVEGGWRWPGVLASALLVGMTIGLLRLVLGLAAVRRYRRFSCPVDDPELIDLMIVVRAELGCTRPVAIHESAALDAPAVVGWFSPLVLLPENWRSWTEDERRAVLAHEVAHITQSDYASWILAQLSLIANFYNPLVHWLVGRLRIEQELAADECGARLTGGRETYLTILANMALRLDNRQASWAARPFLPARGTFLRRIEMLRDAKSVGRPKLALVNRVLVVGVLTAAALIAAGVRAPFVEGSPSSDVFGGAGQPAAEKAPLTGEFIPPGAIAAVAIRVQDLARLAGIEELKAFLQEQQIFKATGVSIDDIEEVKVALLDLGGGPKAPTVQFYVRSNKPLDFLAVLRKMAPNMLEVEYSGGKYGKLPETREGEPCFYMPDGRSLVGAPEARIRDLIQSGGKSTRPTWADSWDKLAGGQVVAMIDVESIGKLLKLTHNVSLLGVVGPVIDNAKTAFLGLNLGKSLNIKASFESRNGDEAQKVSKTLQALATLAENGLDALSKQPQLQQMQGDEKAMTLQLFGIAKDLLEHARVAQEGPSVSVQLQTDKFGIKSVSSLVLPAVQKMRGSAARMTSANNLKQIALAMHNYNATYGSFPPAVVIGPDGKTPHSWRVELLPYMEQNVLFQAYKMDEPWDSPNNRNVLAKMPNIFKADTSAQTTASSYFVLTGPDTIFSGKAGTRIQDITDGTSNTIMVIEAKNDIPWTKPVDLDYDAKKPLPKFGGYFDNGFNAAFADGSVRFIANAIAEQTLRALITKAGGEAIRQQ